MSEPANLRRQLRGEDIIVLPKQLKSMHTFISHLSESSPAPEPLARYAMLGGKFRLRESAESREADRAQDPEWFSYTGEKYRSSDGSIVPCVITRNTQLDGMGSRVISAADHAHRFLQCFRVHEPSSSYSSFTPELSPSSGSRVPRHAGLSNR